MAITLYRRHRRDCVAGHPEDSRSSQLEENRKGWKRCECGIHASGTLKGKFKRQQTGTHLWDEAKTISDAWLTANSWTAPRPVPVAIPEKPKSPTIVEATDAFVMQRKQRGLAKATEGKYATFVKQLRTYIDSKGYVFMSQLTIPDMDAFYASWKDNKRAKARKLNKLKTFVKFCMRRKWITEDIAIDLEPPEGSSIAANKSPFTDEEINRILAACDQIGDPIPPGPGNRNWTGEDVKDFILLMLYTGLRISDAATFDTSVRLKGNDVFLRMHKTRKPLFTWIPDWLVVRLKERERVHGPRIFGCFSKSKSLSVQTERWRLKLAKVFKLAGKFSEKPVPHRFRHSFVRILLEKGVPVGDVAELIGDTEAILRKHYAAWIPGRQLRLSNILQQAFQDQPRV
jgi:integrase